MTEAGNGQEIAAAGQQASDPIRWILAHCKTIAVVGLSPKPERASFDVARYMQAHGYRIIPVNPAAGIAHILGEPVYADLQQAAAREAIDLVACFRRSEDIPPISDAAIAIQAKGVWMQLGVANAPAAARARAADLRVVQDRCLKIEHQSLRS